MTNAILIIKYCSSWMHVDSCFGFLITTTMHTHEQHLTHMHLENATETFVVYTVMWTTATEAQLKHILVTCSLITHTGWIFHQCIKVLCCCFISTHQIYENWWLQYNMHFGIINKRNTDPCFQRKLFLCPIILRPII